MHTLTLRGRALIAVGVVAAGLGWGLGEPALTAVAVLLILVPVIGMVIVRRSRFVLGSARTVEPTRFAVGTEAEVVLTIENGSRFTSGVMLLQDTVPDNLSDSARVLLDRVPSKAQRSQRYHVTGLERGKARIGPLTVTVTDPFGTAALTRSFTATNPVVVTPLIVPLDAAGTSMSPGGRGETMLRSMSARGDDDILPREHRAGDDMRRIHWRATARSGDLMVRREEQSWHSSIVVVLDNRESAHEGTGLDSTFEWAVSASASIALHYLRSGWRVTTVTTDGHLLVETGGASIADTDDVLQAFSEVRLGPHPLSPTLGASVEGASAVVAVLGRLTEHAAQPLARPLAGFTGCLVLEGGPEAFLRAHGWQTATWSRTTAVAEAWSLIAPTRAGARP
ncbi:MAG: DUF58 domain-containing protein [Actinobacteria bacterium]|nr:DUF58 domain-containing protein [Actinomycetota bacterium]